MITFKFELDEIKPDSVGWSEFFKSEAITEPLRAKVDAVAQAANAASSPDNMVNPPFSSDVFIGDNTAIGFIHTSNPHGENAQHSYKRINENIGAGS